MKIALVGYGKMGKTIEQIAIKRGHEIVAKINKENEEDLNFLNNEHTDVAIEFTNPESAFDNVSFLLKNKIPTISGSTGWTDKLDLAKDICVDNDTAFLWASNYSVGVNLFFKINKFVADLMSAHQDYKPSVEEIHHTQKLDAPSGTAITLAEQILANYPNLEGWQLSPENLTDKLTITAIRQDPAPGTHTISYQSAIDDIELKHTAHSRDGFALGAVLAAEFIARKKGVFTMEDVLFSGL